MLLVLESRQVQFAVAKPPRLLLLVLQLLTLLFLAALWVLQIQLRHPLKLDAKFSWVSFLWV